MPPRAVKSRIIDIEEVTRRLFESILRGSSIYITSFQGDKRILVICCIVPSAPFIIQHICKVQNIKCDLKGMGSASSFDKEILGQFDIKAMFKCEEVAIPFDVFAFIIFQVKIGCL
ncbi:hypothetical protein ACFLTA_08395 [Bacteroidota bacterium]